eukprot:GDKI01011378.1.p1 GENE.GDKI01011378.1~~GDKI01011378.1.p1  ORF type:complete len:129 (-),score=24.88 GDKI01011378.1:99-485(-)
MGHGFPPQTFHTPPPPPPLSTHTPPPHTVLLLLPPCVRADMCVRAELSECVRARTSLATVLALKILRVLLSELLFTRFAFFIRIQRCLFIFVLCTKHINPKHFYKQCVENDAKYNGNKGKQNVRVCVC